MLSNALANHLLAVVLLTLALPRDWSHAVVGLLIITALGVIVDLMRNQPGGLELPLLNEP